MRVIRLSSESFYIAPTCKFCTFIFSVEHCILNVKGEKTLNAVDLFPIT